MNKDFVNAFIVVFALTAVVFGSSPGAVAQTDALEVTPEGKVGIGTASPDEELEIEGVDDIHLLVNSTGLDSDAGIKLQNDAQTWTLYNFGGLSNKFRLFDSSTGLVPFEVEAGAPANALTLGPAGVAINGALDIANDKLLSVGRSHLVFSSGHGGTYANGYLLSTNLDYDGTVSEGMITLRVRGHGYGNGEIIDFAVSTYLYYNVDFVVSNWTNFGSYDPGTVTLARDGGKVKLWWSNPVYYPHFEVWMTVHPVWSFAQSELEGWTITDALAPTVGAVNPTQKPARHRGLKLLGANPAEEAVDLSIGYSGNFVVDLTPGSDSAQFLDLRTENNYYGLIMRESDGTGTSAYSNHYVVDDGGGVSNDELRIAVSAGQLGAELSIFQDGDLKLHGGDIVMAPGALVDGVDVSTLTPGTTDHAQLANVTASQHHVKFAPSANPAVNHSSYIPGHGDGSDCTSSNLTYARGINASGSAACSTPGEGPTDNRLVRAHGVAGIQGSGVTLNDGEDLSGLRHLTMSGGLHILGQNTATLILKPPTLGSTTLCLHNDQIKKCSSSGVQKENIVSLGSGEGLGYVLQLNPRRYNWIDDGRLDYGFVAEEVYEVLPELAPEQERVNYRHMVSILAAAVQDLAARVEQLENEGQQ